MSAGTIQAGIAAALRDPVAPPPPGLRAWNGSDPTLRFAVYRNNVVSSLVAALAETFPVVRELVGSAFFDAMARCFVAVQLPTSPILAEYGAGFADFVAAFEPASGLPYLPDIARLEFARVQAFHAADAPVLTPEHVAAHLRETWRLPGARLLLHPSVQVLSSRHAIVSLWSAHQGHCDLAAVDPTRPEAALVLREDDDAAVIALPHAAARFIQALADGRTLADAVDVAEFDASSDPSPFDLPTALGLLITHSILTDWLAPDKLS